MQISTRQCVTTIASTLLLAFTSFGCGDDEDDDGTDPADTAIDMGTARGEAISNDADGMLTDEDLPAQMGMIASILMTIDDGEVQQAQAALPALDDDDAADFAQDMIDDHTTHSQALLDLLVDYNVSPIDNDISAALRAESATMLRDLAASNDVDFFYMNAQVMMHEEARVLVNTLAVRTDGTAWNGYDTSDKFHSLLMDTRDLIEQHRDDAADVLRDL